MTSTMEINLDLAEQLKLAQELNIALEADNAILKSDLEITKEALRKICEGSPDDLSAPQELEYDWDIANDALNDIKNLSSTSFPPPDTSGILELAAAAYKYALVNDNKLKEVYYRDLEAIAEFMPSATRQLLESLGGGV